MTILIFLIVFAFMMISSSVKAQGITTSVNNPNKNLTFQSNATPFYQVGRFQDSTSFWIVAPSVQFKGVGFQVSDPMPTTNAGITWTNDSGFLKRTTIANFKLPINKVIDLGDSLLSKLNISNFTKATMVSMGMLASSDLIAGIGLNKSGSTTLSVDPITVMMAARVEDSINVLKAKITANTVAINTKFPIPTGTNLQYIDGTGALITFPTPLKGDKGDPGVTGSTGSQGVAGPTGPQGNIGLTGAKGDVGSQGIQGATGATGATGAMGIQGSIGNTGAAGSQGIQGLTGPQGAVGTPATPNISGTGISIVGNVISATGIPIYGVSGLLTSNGKLYADTIALATSSTTISLTSQLTAMGCTNFRLISATGYRIGATTGTSPNIAVTSITSNSVSIIANQTNTAVVSILGINVLSGLPTILVPDPANIKVVLSYVAW